MGRIIPVGFLRWGVFGCVTIVLCEIVFYVILKQLCTHLEVLLGMVVSIEHVEVGNEVFPIKMDVTLEVDIRQKFQISVHVKLHIADSGFVEKLH